MPIHVDSLVNACLLLKYIPLHCWRAHNEKTAQSPKIKKFNNESMKPWNRLGIVLVMCLRRKSISLIRHIRWDEILSIGKQINTHVLLLSWISTLRRFLKRCKAQFFYVYLFIYFVLTSNFNSILFRLFSNN